MNLTCNINNLDYMYSFIRNKNYYKYVNLIGSYIRFLPNFKIFFLCESEPFIVSTGIFAYV